MERDHRLLGARLDPHEQGQERDPQQDQAPYADRAPVSVLGIGEADEDRHHAGREGQDARVIDIARRVRAPDRRQQPGDHAQRDQPDGQVDVEDPVPAEVVCDRPAQARADQERDAEDGTKQTLVLPALARSEEVTNDRQADGEQRAGSEPLDRPEEDQLPHRLAQA